MFDMINSINAINQFNEAIRNAGLKPKQRVLGKGKVERFSIEGDDRNEKTGWAVLYLDGIPAGSFGDWRTGDKHTWCAVDRSTLAKNDQIAVTKMLAKAEMERAKEQKRLYKIASSKAMEFLSLASQAIEHPYLKAKKVNAFYSRELHGDLLIPIQDSSGEITSLQRILSDGSKRFLTGGRIAGCFHLFGVPDDLTYVCEGWATGATIHMATGRPVVVAFNAGNISSVVTHIGIKYPKARLVVASDNDAWGVKNTGLEAARATGLPVVYPNFQPSDVKPTDFNDLMCLEGMEVVQEQLRIDLPEIDHAPIVVSEDLPDQWVALPDTRGEKNKPISTIDNLKEVCRRLGIVVRYNVISKKEEIIIPNQEGLLDNKDNVSLAWVESMCAKYDMPTDKVGSFIGVLADQNPYNPVLQMIESKPWDGKSRFKKLCATIKALGEEEDDFLLQYKEMLIRKWMLSAVAAAANPNGISSQGVLVLQGDQAIGKTTWFRSLLPDNPELRADGVILDLRDKDSQINALSFWLVELGEIDATFNKSDAAQLKAFITKNKDVIRLPYAKRKSEFPRRTVFFASVNSKYFLRDDTGNRRYWALQCEDINYRHGLNMQQIWAEVYAAYKAGEKWSLTSDELNTLNSYNEYFKEIDPVEDILGSRLSWDDAKHLWTDRNLSTILDELGLDQDRRVSMKVSEFLRKNGSVRVSKNNRGAVFKAPRIKKGVTVT